MAPSQNAKIPITPKPYEFPNWLIFVIGIFLVFSGMFASLPLLAFGVHPLILYYGFLNIDNPMNLTVMIATIIIPLIPVAILFKRRSWIFASTLVFLLLLSIGLTLFFLQCVNSCVLFV
jgi:hypothetical protein